MENRFTIKDLFIFLLLIGVIVVVVAAMFQYDRQWESVQNLEKQMAQLNKESIEQTRELQGIRQALDKGIKVDSAPITRLPWSDGDASSRTPVRPPDHATTVPPAPAEKDGFSALREAQAMPNYATGDWLIYNVGVKVSKLTPLLSTDVYASYIQNRVMDTLAYRDPETLEWLPMLATSWSVSDDGLEIRAKLRPNVKFSNGEPFTADDLVFTYQWVMNPEVDAARTRVAVERIKSVEKINELEVLFRFKEPFFNSLSLVLEFSPMCRSFYSRYTPREFNESVGALIGTGPYRLADPESWRPGKPLELIPNERYWGIRPTFSRIYYYEVENDAASLTMFRNGEIDVYGATPEQYESMIRDAALMERVQKFEFYPRDGGYTYIGWSQKRAGKTTFFADKTIRQAMTMLIDRERLARDIWRGHAKPAPGPFGVISKQNDPQIKPWPYDPRKAMEILQSAGFDRRNNAGVLCKADGTEFRFKLTYNNSSPDTERIALQIKDGLARVGIVMEQEPTDWPVMLKKLDTRDYDAIMLGWSGGIETDIYQMFHSTQIEGGGDNFISYANTDLDKIIEEARRTVDEEVRMQIWRKAHQILHEDQPYSFLLYREALNFMDKRIHNVKPTRSGLNYIQLDAMPIPWFVPANLQKHTN